MLIFTYTWYFQFFHYLFNFITISITSWKKKRSSIYTFKIIRILQSIQLNVHQFQTYLISNAPFQFSFLFYFRKLRVYSFLHEKSKNCWGYLTGNRPFFTYKDQFVSRGLISFYTAVARHNAIGVANKRHEKRINSLQSNPPRVRVNVISIVPFIALPSRGSSRAVDYT